MSQSAHHQNAYLEAVAFAYQKAIESNPNFCIFCHHLFQILKKMQRFDKYLQALDSFLSLKNKLNLKDSLTTNKL